MHGPVSKLHEVLWTQLGYATRCKRVAAHEVGGASSQSCLVVIRIVACDSERWTWDEFEAAQNCVRPMSNLLTPPGLLRRTKYLAKWPGAAYDPGLDPMPSRVGAMIVTDQGFRRLRHEESARGLGLPKGPGPEPTRAILERTTTVFHFEYLVGCWPRDPSPQTSEPPNVQRGSDEPADPSPIDPKAANYRFEWRPPNLTEGGKWWCDRVASLKHAAAQSPNSQALIRDGLAMLNIHRQNYDERGPTLKKLQLLWWEWPPEHWDGVRDGSSMNFMVTPIPDIKENAVMTREQLLIAIEFVNELEEIGALGDNKNGNPILCNAPLFILPKDAQPGSWRVLATDKGRREDVVNRK
jgi:hypothetical protein